MDRKRLGRIGVGAIASLLMFLIALMVVWGIVMLALDPVKAPDPVAEANARPIGVETLFMASATIMALSVFGSVLSIGMQSRSKILTLGWIFKIYTACPIMALIIIQSLFMRSLIHGVDIYHTSLWFSLVSWWIQGTAVSLVTISFFVFVADFCSFNQNVDE